MPIPANEVLGRFWSKVSKRGHPKGCWEWTAGVFKSGGYGQFNMRVAGKRQPYRAHRISYELAHGPIPSDLCVLHECDNRVCVNPAHLFLGTRGDNCDDMHAKGRARK